MENFVEPLAHSVVLVLLKAQVDTCRVFRVELDLGLGDAVVLDELLLGKVVGELDGPIVEPHCHVVLPLSLADDHLREQVAGVEGAVYHSLDHHIDADWPDHCLSLAAYRLIHRPYHRLNKAPDVSRLAHVGVAGQAVYLFSGVDTLGLNLVAAPLHPDGDDRAM